MYRKHFLFAKTHADTDFCLFLKTHWRFSRNCSWKNAFGWTKAMTRKCGRNFLKSFTTAMFVLEDFLRIISIHRNKRGGRTTPQSIFIAANVGPWTSVRKTRPKSAENSEVTTLKYFFSTFFYVLPIARPVSFHTVKIIHSKVNLMSLNTFRCFTEHQNYFLAL